jgi:carbamoyl-phosphate synthase large subunit
MPRVGDVKRVLLLGSGAIKIGEAGEFDYSGAQAIKALKEEGVEVVLVNPNIATIQTDMRFVDRVHFLPITPDYIASVIEKERPDGILLSFGGQTALNCGVELAERGILEKYGVRVLGTGIRSIELADDRDKFRALMAENGVAAPKSRGAGSMEEALAAAAEIGYPVMVRVAYTLGGQGTGVAHDAEELRRLTPVALASSRIHQILVEEYLAKWKEVEYEVLRDAADDCAIVCNMENFDPMGIHTGESIVVAPSQTLNNSEYHALRSASFKVARALGIVGECNVQYALNPVNGEYRVIEVNSRLSRSSALASKATGYPIAYVAAKISLGYTLPELKNKVTGATTAFFEPSLDYIVVKMPRWDFAKFHGVDRRIGTQMKSVGEVMAVGRNFPEALQKAIRMLDTGKELLDAGIDADPAALRDGIVLPTDLRIYQIAKALETGITVQEIADITGIDPWFLDNIAYIVSFRAALRAEGLGKANLREAKRLGFSDRSIGRLFGMGEDAVRDLRHSQGIAPRVKQIDTLAAEWPSKTNYLYTTYDAAEDDAEPTKTKKVLVLGSGTYHIGSSVEFDWCCVNMAWALRGKGYEVIMLNCNPETVSTDFDVMDRLYFEELTLERVLDVVEREAPEGVVVSVGGQTPNALATRLAAHGVRLLGSTAESIDAAEDRGRFSDLLDRLGVSQPVWSRLQSVEQAKEFAGRIGYPVLIRPSYVLSGSAMSVAYNEAQLERQLASAAEVSRDYPVTMSKFILNAREVEVDGVSDGVNVFLGPAVEHIENAGVHSGDATMAIPTLTIFESVKETIRENTRKIARSLGVRGPFNVQYLVKGEDVQVIECNLRASRSMPFVSKVTGINLMSLAATAITGGAITDGEAMPLRYGVKSPVFSFMRLANADPLTGVEMASTGEVACFGSTFKEAFLNSIAATGMRLPKRGDPILLSVGGPKDMAVKIARKLHRKGYRLYGTRSTAEAIRTAGVPCEHARKISEGGTPDIATLITGGVIRLVINTPSPEGVTHAALSDGYTIRRRAVEYGVPLITNLELAEAFADCL